MIAKIHNIYKSLTDAEKRIADIILSDPEAVVDMGVKAIAETAKTAPSAVTRFCKSVGVDGFSKLKLLLAAENAKISPENTMPKVCSDDNVQSVFENVFRSGINTLYDTFSMLDFADIEKITDIFINSERIVFFGVGTSLIIATDACYRFSQLGIIASCCSDVLFMNVTAANLKKGDTAVFVSHSGDTKATVDAMRYAKESGATIIGITSFSGSILAKESDYCVVAFSDEHNYPVEAVSARVAHMCIIDAFMMVMVSKRKESSKYITERNKILKNIRY